VIYVTFEKREAHTSVIEVRGSYLVITILALKAEAQPVSQKNGHQLSVFSFQSTTS
jgi:hypothetical protein